MLLEVKNISYRYNKSSKWILKDVSFKIDSKERVALVGPSGYGKSTLSKIISGNLNVLWIYLDWVKENRLQQIGC